MTRLSLREAAGSLLMAAPTFIRGPMAMSVIWPGHRRLWAWGRATGWGGGGVRVSAPCRCRCWGEQSGTAGRIGQARMEMRTAMNLDRCKRLNSVRHGADGNEQIYQAKFWCGREDSNLHALRR